MFKPESMRDQVQSLYLPSGVMWTGHTSPSNHCKTQNLDLCSKEEKPHDPINQPSRCNTQEALLLVALSVRSSIGTIFLQWPLAAKQLWYSWVLWSWSAQSVEPLCLPKSSRVAPLLPMLSGAQREAPGPDCPNLRLGTGL